jgi:hypothetical protein
MAASSLVTFLEAMRDSIQRSEKALVLYERKVSPVPGSTGIWHFEGKEECFKTNKQVLTHLNELCALYQTDHMTRVQLAAGEQDVPVKTWISRIETDLADTSVIGNPHPTFQELVMSRKRMRTLVGHGTALLDTLPKTDPASRSLVQKGIELGKRRMDALAEREEVACFGL